jgi:hypothetical protein
MNLSIEEGNKIIKYLLTKKEFIFYTILSIFVILFSIFIVVAKIAVDSSKLSCNGKGRIYVDEQDVCSCYQCYLGDRCETYNTNCTIDNAIGNPLIFQEFWDQVNQEITIKDSYRIGYNFDNSKLSVKKNLKKDSIFNLHQTFQNIEFNRTMINRTIVIGTEASLLQASLWAIKRKANVPKMTIFAKTPFYSYYSDFTKLVRFFYYLQYPQDFTFSTEENLDPSNLIEIVTSPNNPDVFLYLINRE